MYWKIFCEKRAFLTKKTRFLSDFFYFLLQNLHFFIDFYWFLTIFSFFEGLQRGSLIFPPTPCAMYVWNMTYSLYRAARTSGGTTATRSLVPLLRGDRKVPRGMSSFSLCSFKFALFLVLVTFAKWIICVLHRFLSVHLHFMSLEQLKHNSCLSKLLSRHFDYFS